MARAADSVSKFVWLHWRVLILRDLGILYSPSVGQSARRWPAARDSVWLFLEAPDPPALSTLPDSFCAFPGIGCSHHRYQRHALFGLRCRDASSDASQS